MKRIQWADDLKALLFTLPAMVPLAVFWFFHWLGKLMRNVLLIAASISMAFPFYWMATSALKSNNMVPSTGELVLREGI